MNTVYSAFIRIFPITMSQSIERSVMKTGRYRGGDAPVRQGVAVGDGERGEGSSDTDGSVGDEW